MCWNGDIDGFGKTLGQIYLYRVESSFFGKTSNEITTLYTKALFFLFMAREELHFNFIFAFSFSYRTVFCPSKDGICIYDNYMYHWHIHHYTLDRMTLPREIFIFYWSSERLFCKQYYVQYVRIVLP